MANVELNNVRENNIDNTVAEWCSDCSFESELNYHEDKLVQQQCQNDSCGQWLLPCAQCPFINQCEDCPFTAHLKTGYIIPNGAKVVIKGADTGLEGHEDIAMYIDKIAEIQDTYGSMSDIRMYNIVLENEDGHNFHLEVAETEIQPLEIKLK